MRDFLNAPDWPPDYGQHYAWRQRQVVLLRNVSGLLAGAKEHYRTRPVEFIDHWVDTYDPRNAGRAGLATKFPLLLFDRQKQLIDFLMECLGAEANGLVEKCRDMGATWVACAFSVWLWLFWDGASVGWGSRKEQLVDHLGDMDSIFEKMRFIVSNLPRDFLPAGFKPDIHMTYMRIVNPENGATITGESGDNIGRGGRKLIYFKDESSFYDRPEKIESALTDNTRVQIDISSVSSPNSVFHRKREAGVEWTPGSKVLVERTNVFVMDWRDHPAKTQAWYDARRANAENNSLLHVFEREVDRNYAAGVDVIIKPAWIKASYDAHKRLGIPEDGMWAAALDVADEGLDLNAIAKRRGIVLKQVAEWAERDTGKTARRAVAECEDTPSITIEYDCIGVGAGVKAEANRLADEKVTAAMRVKWRPWDAGSGPLHPEQRVVKGDSDTPLNEDFFANLKAQGWWQLARRFEKTFKAITQGIKYSPDELISISTEIPLALRLKLEKELSQPKADKTARLKMIVDKTPAGTKSPNLGDAVMMCYWPAHRSRYTLENVL